MKNHKKAREFCEKEVYMEEGAKERLFDKVKKQIYTANSSNTSLKELMENFGKDLGDKEPKEAIGMLETIYEYLGLKNTQELLEDLQNFRSEWNSTNKDDLFDEVFNSMYRTAQQKHNEYLLKHLETYKEYTVNHEKAKELYNAKDQDKEFLDMVTNKIHGAPNSYTLKGLMRDLGSTFAHDEESEEAIILLEAIYDALGKEQRFIEQYEKISIDDKALPLTEDNKLNSDALFYEALYSMYKVAVHHNDEDLLGRLKEYYPELD